MKKEECAFVRRSIAASLVAVLTLSLVTGTPMAAQQQEPAAQQPSATQSTTAGQSGNQNSQPAAPALETRPQDAAPPEQVPPNQNTHPVGTAAAPLTKPTGVAASRPAGAAIAPAKQRRVRTIMIRIGIIVGAAAAVGTVAGLSRSSSSRP